MAFSINPNFTSIPSYDQAIRSWQAAVIFPKDRRLHNPLLPRGLVDARKRHMTIERTPAEEFVLRLYGKAIVTWRKDGSFTLCEYASRSTIVFANRCTPSGMFVALCGGCFSITHDGCTYKVRDEITFRQHQGVWKPDRIEPWSIPFVNRERAAQAYRETNYREFRLWFNTYVQMATKPEELHYSWPNRDKVVSMLRDRSQWRELVTKYYPGAWSEPNKVLLSIRTAIHHVYDCIEHKSVPYLPAPGRQGHYFAGSVE